MRDQQEAEAESRTAELGICDKCGQEMLCTTSDCWHPWHVAVACPPEPRGDSGEYGEWVMAGNETGRPGREHFVSMALVVA